MTNFDNDLTNLPKIIQFCATKSSFQQQLTNAFANKTSKLCKVLKEQHEKLVNNAITTSYKKVSKKTQNQINKQGKNILKNKEIINRMFVNGKIKLFDHVKRS